MANRGIAPPDLSTDTGMFRLYVNDQQYTALDPVEPGYGDYTSLSDAEIEAFLAQGRDSLYRGLAEYHRTLANQASLESKTVKDYDLQVDLRTQYKALMEVASMWAARADEEDGVDGLNDIFDSFSHGEDYVVSRPEAAPYPVV